MPGALPCRLLGARHFKTGDVTGSDHVALALLQPIACHRPNLINHTLVDPLQTASGTIRTSLGAWYWPTAAPRVLLKPRTRWYDSSTRRQLAERDIDEEEEDDDGSESNGDDYEERYSESSNTSHNVRRDPEITASIHTSNARSSTSSSWARASRVQRAVQPVGRGIRRGSARVRDLSFYAPKATSAAWMPKFQKLIHHCHSARLYKIAMPKCAA